ncbi:MAG: multidrug effflux MFS transporter [Sandaracinaceae bacterium]
MAADGSQVAPELARAPEASGTKGAGIGEWELVAMVASLMAVNALAIDIMLPALGEIARDLAVPGANDRQLVVVVYVFGLGVGQLAAGPLGDRFGRKPVLLGALVLYALLALACIVAPSFGLLVLARGLQGLVASAPRTLALSVVRDLYQGSAMARLMSLVMMVFMVVPIVAPGLGQLVLLVASWRAIFGLLVATGVFLFLWVALRLRETQRPEDRRPLSLSAVREAYLTVLRVRVSRGYTLASGLVFGSLFGYLASSEQIFEESYDAAASFGLYFAVIAVFMSVSAFLNSRIVERLGARRVAHGALSAFIAVAAVQVALALAGALTLPAFVLTMGMLMFAFGMIGANFTSLAMEPLGKIAGTASAALGFTSTALSSVLGGLIARGFDGTPLPFVLGVLLLGGASLAVIAVTEGGSLFRADPPSFEVR